MPSTRTTMDDDFILTISDDDTNVPDLDGEEEESFAAGAIERSNGHKRKRDLSPIEDETKDKSSKSSKKRKKAKKDVEKIAENDTEEKVMENGDALDSDFEFDVGGLQDGVNDGFDGWDLASSSNGLSGKMPKKGVEIDEIIARRRQKELALKDSNSVHDEQDEKSDDIASSDHAELEIEDDELLAEDGFGMGANEANEANEASDGETSDTSSKHDDTSSKDVEEDEEVAEPVAHPDDDLSDNQSEEAEDESALTQEQVAFFAPADPSGDDSSHGTSLSSFQTMSLSRPILKGLAAIGFTSPTPIQAKTVPVALLGKDLVGGAETGSGKTAAFVIPILERLLYRPKKLPTTRVGILMPTRELAVQCHNVAVKLASFTDITFALLVGGLSLREQEQTLKKRPDVVIATPGRFIDHMRNSASFVVENLEILILDEADRMLEDGFADELNEILATIPKSRQTMLFSATMTNDVDKLIRVGLNQPVRLMVDAKKQTVQGLVQEFVKMKGGKAEIEEERRLAYLLHLCSKTYTSKTIVFFPRKTQAHRVKILFALQGIKAAELHGSMSQEQRLNAITAFRDGDCTHLLATDLASRGLDIPRVETVVNFTVPNTTTNYLHRVGRTARAGRQGVSCTLFSAAKEKTSSKINAWGSNSSERTLLRPILRLARNQSAKIRTRTLPPDIINDLVAEIDSLQTEIDAILLDEKEERLLQQTERDVTKGENFVKYEDEIRSRPKRTWFQAEKDKEATSKLGLKEYMGRENEQSIPKSEKTKKKLSGKDKKRLEARDERVKANNHGWKKGKEERAGKGVLQKPKNAKKTTKDGSADKSRSKPKGQSRVQKRK